MRMELGSANGSGKSSLHSSQSDISATSTPMGKHSTNRFPLLSKYNKYDLYNFDLALQRVYLKLVNKCICLQTKNKNSTSITSTLTCNIM